jgi:hypothetical protein
MNLYFISKYDAIITDNYMILHCISKTDTHFGFTPSDGTEEPEMFCFGEIGRHIVVKSVEATMRAPRNKDSIPLDITIIIYSHSTLLSLSQYYQNKFFVMQNTTKNTKPRNQDNSYVTTLDVIGILKKVKISLKEN